MTTATIERPPPSGFRPHTRKSPVTDPWEPIHARTTDEAVILGLWTGERHCNSRGFVHGGLISALADNAMGLSCRSAVTEGASLLTVRLSIDFVGTARVGQWLQVETQYRRIGSTLCFTQAFVTADGEVCARADAVFRVVRG